MKGVSLFGEIHFPISAFFCNQFLKTWPNSVEGFQNPKEALEHCIVFTLIFSISATRFKARVIPLD